MGREKNRQNGAAGLSENGGGSKGRILVILEKRRNSDFQQGAEGTKPRGGVLTLIADVRCNDKMKNEWPFHDPKNVAVFTTEAIINGRLPILVVTHDADDGAWQFLDGKQPDEGNARIVALCEIVKLDPSVTALADLPEGWIAERGTPDSDWKRKRISEPAGGAYVSPAAGDPSAHP